MSSPAERFVAVSLSIQEAAALADFETLDRLLHERQTSIDELANVRLTEAETTSIRRADTLLRESISRHMSDALTGQTALSDGHRLHSALRSGPASSFDTTG